MGVTGEACPKPDQRNSGLSVTFYQSRCISHFLLFMGMKSRRAAPVKSWRGRPIF